MTFDDYLSLLADRQKIEDYAASIGLRGPVADFSVDVLIESHKKFRQQSQDLMALRQKAYEEGKQLGREFALENEFITVARIRELTVKELMALLEEESLPYFQE